MPTDSLSAVQLRPPHAEEMAEMFEQMAAEARAGEFVSFVGVVMRPGASALRCSKGSRLSMIAALEIAKSELIDLEKTNPEYLNKV
jgi:hypothetical protein